MNYTRKVFDSVISLRNYIRLTEDSPANEGVFHGSSGQCFMNLSSEYID